MGYNDQSHKDPLMVSGAGARPAKSLLTSPVFALSDALPCGEPAPALLITCSKQAYKTSPLYREHVREWFKYWGWVI